MAETEVSRQGDTNLDPAGARTERPNEFYIVGVGASAGGLEALEHMFKNMPESTGMAFVIVQHLSPDFKSLMDELLARYTRMPIYRVEDGMPVQPNSIYLIPPKREMIISDGKLLLTDKDPTQSLSLPIDHFFRSLAQDAGRRAIAVVLSGTGSDGSRGIRDIHEAGGLVIAQSEESAKFDGMPKSAVETGVVDVSAEPERIPELLTRYASNPMRAQWGQEDERPVHESSLESIFRLLQRRHKIDFNFYKPTTIGRRIERRIQLNHHGDLEQYVQCLESDPAEVDQLYKDLLIGVTRFFRDRDAFESLENEILPQLLMQTPASEEFRVWVAACGTGEEVYSIAMLISECMQTMNRHLNVKIFGTDVHQFSLDFAHQGVYPAASVAEMPTTRRDLYFTRTDTGYQVSPQLRKMIVFAPHNLVKDAPFTHLHLIACRNFLIYLRNIAQKKVLSLFHFGLKTGGVLFLGASETPGVLGEEFDTLNERWKIYRKRRDIRLPTETRGVFGLTEGAYRETVHAPVTRPLVTTDNALLTAYDQLLNSYMPPGLLVNERREVVHMFSGAGKFLNLADGRMSSSLLDLVDGDLKLALTGALQRVVKSGEPVSYSRVNVRTKDGQLPVRLDVKPVGKPGSDMRYLLTFQELNQVTPEEAVPESLDLDDISRDRLKELELELRYTKENLQATIEELETSNEELQATNEELVASNEELQSTNEELHSVNEELYTVNAEYQKKIHELTELTNDMDNLLVSTKVHTLFLDKHLCIRKFTPEIADVFNLIPQDLGRRIEGFTHKLVCDGLLDKVTRVLVERGQHEEEVQVPDGIHYLMRILPYVADDETGVVLTLVDITPLKQMQQQLEDQRMLLRSLLDQSLCFIYVKDLQGRYLELNQFGAQNLGKSREDILGHTDLEVLGENGAVLHAADVRVLTTGQRQLLEQVIPTTCGDRVFFSLKSPMLDCHGKTIGTCGVCIDITERKRAEAALVESERRYKRAVKASTAGIWEWRPQNGEAFLSNRLKELLGFSAEDLADEFDVINQLVHPDDRDERWEAIQQALEDSDSYDIRFRINLKSGETRWFRSRAYIERDALGQATMVTGSLTDIDKEKQYEASLAAEVRQRDEFLAMLSHELRNPMGAVLNAIEVIRKEHAEAPATNPQYEVIQRQTRHMARLLDDLLDVARLGQHKMELRKLVTDLAALAEEVLESVAHQFEAKDQNLHVAIAAGPLPIFADPARIKQAQINLLTNASKYSPRGGDIWYDIDHEGSDAVITVRDEGEGISRELLGSVFDLFVQSESALARSAGGMGVGLSLARSIVQAHEGTILAHSTGLGAGSSFTIRLPLTSEPPASPVPRPHFFFAGRKVLLVEDNDDARIMLAKSLRLEGFEVRAAQNGKTALEQFHAFRPDVAVIDIGLPVMDGYQLAREVRQSDKLGHPLLIALTGYGRAADREAAQKAGFDAHLVKPLNPAELYAIIEKKCARQNVT